MTISAVTDMTGPGPSSTTAAPNVDRGGSGEDGRRGRKEHRSGPSPAVTGASARRRTTTTTPAASAVGELSGPLSPPESVHEHEHEHVDTSERAGDVHMAEEEGNISAVSGTTMMTTADVRAPKRRRILVSEEGVRDALALLDGIVPPVSSSSSSLHAISSQADRRQRSDLAGRDGGMAIDGGSARLGWQEDGEDGGALMSVLEEGGPEGDDSPDDDGGAPCPCPWLKGEEKGQPRAGLGSSDDVGQQASTSGTSTGSARQAAIAGNAGQER